jgi:signal transduction histidine kinase
LEQLHKRSEYQGSGIGLAIVKEIISRHGGEITAHSALGKGSTFYIYLPEEP